MFRTLIQREFMGALLSLKFQVTVLLLGLLSIGGTVLLIENFEDRIEGSGKGMAALQEMAEEYGIRKGWGLNLPLPIRPLEGLFTGTSTEKEGSLFLHAIFAPDFQKSLGDLSSADLFPPVDITFIVTVIGTLLAILMAHDLITREKEQGTLRLMLSNSVSRDAVMLSKWIGNFLTVWIAFTLFFLISALLLMVLPSEFSLSGQWGRLLLIYGVSILLLALFFSFGLMFSALCHHSRNALILLLFCWVLFVYVIPDISPYIAGAFRPIPSVQEFLAQKLQLTFEWEQELSRGMREMQSRAFQGRAPEGTVKVWKEDRAKLEATIGEKMERRARQMDEAFRNRLNAQIHLSRSLSSLSPVAVGTYLITDLAGTGVLTHEMLGDTIEEYWESVREEWNDIEDWEDLPTFKERTLNWKEVFERDKLDLLLLLVLNVLFFMGAYAAFLRYDVR